MPHMWRSIRFLFPNFPVPHFRFSHFQRPRMEIRIVEYRPTVEFGLLSTIALFWGSESMKLTYSTNCLRTYRTDL